MRRKDYSANHKKVVLFPKRYPSGDYKRQGSRKDQAYRVVEVVLNQPHRVHAQCPSDPMLGSAIGRLYRAKKMSLEQYNTAEHVLAILSAAHRYFSPTVLKNLGMDPSRIKGRSCYSEPSEEFLLKVKHAYKDLCEALAAGPSARSSMEVFIEVLLCDLDPKEPSLTVLKQGLDLLSSVWTKRHTRVHVQGSFAHYS